MNKTEFDGKTVQPQAALREKRLFLLDMDGTLYLDDTLFDGAAEFLRYVRERGGRYVFLTNNSSRSVTAYQEKLARLGISAGREEFLTSVDALIAYLDRHGFRGRLLYVFGTASFRRQLEEAGFRVTVRRSEAVEALVCGFDTELTFQKLEDACILLNRGVEFIAANPDWVCPTWYGYVPDCGSVCEMLYRATKRRPVFIGKPQPEMALLAMENFGCSAAETLLIGDRVYTDIACAVRAGIDAALVLSGESTVEDAAHSPEKPTYIFENIRAVLDALRMGEETNETEL